LEYSLLSFLDRSNPAFLSRDISRFLRLTSPNFFSFEVMPLFPLSALRMERNSLPVLLRVEMESSAVFQPVVPQTRQEWK